MTDYDQIQDMIDTLFLGLNDKLDETVDPQFFKEPRRFKSIIEVLDVVGQSPIRLNKNLSDEDFMENLRQSSPGYARLISEQVCCTYLYSYS